VVTALYALQRPTAGLEHLAKLLSGNRLHNSISVTWASTPATALSVATSIQPCAASLMFDNVSGRSSPSDTHPGKPGTSAQKPPSSAGCTRTLSFMMHSIYRGFWWFKGARAYSLAQPLLIKAHRPDNPILPAFGQAGNGKPVTERRPGGRDPAPGGRSRGPAQGPADALRRHRADALGGALRVTGVTSPGSSLALQHMPGCASPGSSLVRHWGQVLHCNICQVGDRRLGVCLLPPRCLGHGPSHRGQPGVENSPPQSLGLLSTMAARGLSPLGSTAGCGKPHVPWCGSADGRNPVSLTRSWLQRHPWVVWPTPHH
jgi:hypothetical protein